MQIKIVTIEYSTAHKLCLMLSLIYSLYMIFHSVSWLVKSFTMMLSSLNQAN